MDRGSARSFLIWNSFLSSFAVVFPGAWDGATEANWDRRFAVNLKLPCFQLTKTFPSRALAAQVGRDWFQAGGRGCRERRSRTLPRWGKHSEDRDDKIATAGRSGPIDLV